MMPFSFMFVSLDRALSGRSCRAGDLYQQNFMAEHGFVYGLVQQG